MRGGGGGWGGGGCDEGLGSMGNKMGSTGLMRRPRAIDGNGT